MSTFTWRGTKDGRVLVDWRGRTVVTLAGSKASRFLVDVDGADAESEQLLLARITGNFKRGNER